MRITPRASGVMFTYYQGRDSAPGQDPATIFDTVHLGSGVAAAGGGVSLRGSPGYFSDSGLYMDSGDAVNAAGSNVAYIEQTFAQPAPTDEPYIIVADFSPAFTLEGFAQSGGVGGDAYWLLELRTGSALVASLKVRGHWSGSAVDYGAAILSNGTDTQTTLGVLRADTGSLNFRMAIWIDPATGKARAWVMNDAALSDSNANNGLCYAANNVYKNNSPVGDDGFLSDGAYSDPEQDVAKTVSVTGIPDRFRLSVCSATGAAASGHRRSRFNLHSIQVAPASSFIGLLGDSIGVRIECALSVEPPGNGCCFLPLSVGGATMEETGNGACLGHQSDWWRSLGVGGLIYHLAFNDAIPADHDTQMIAQIEAMQAAGFKIGICTSPNLGGHSNEANVNAINANIREAATVYNIPLCDMRKILQLGYPGAPSVWNPAFVGGGDKYGYNQLPPVGDLFADDFQTQAIAVADGGQWTRTMGSQTLGIGLAVGGETISGLYSAVLAPLGSKALAAAILDLHRDTGNAMSYAFDMAAGSSTLFGANEHLSLAAVLGPPVAGGPFTVMENNAYHLTAGVPWTTKPASAVVGPYHALPTSGGGNVGGYSYLNYGHQFRVRQTGLITQVRAWIPGDCNATSMKLTIWRYNGSTFDLVSKSEELVNHAGWNPGNVCTFTLTTPIAAQEGDYQGWCVGDPSNTKAVYAQPGQTGVSVWYKYTSGQGGEPPATGYNWLAQSELAGYCIPAEMTMASPLAVFIGDSIMSGALANYSFADTVATTDLTVPISSHWAALYATAPAYQNMGIAGQTTTQIQARFAADVVAANPRLAVIQGGVNDISNAGAGPYTTAKTTFLAKWTAILDACVAASIVPVVLPIFPWTNGSTNQMNARDDWNSALATLVGTYATAIFVHDAGRIDLDSTLGQNRSGGPGGNLWDIKTAYNGDGVHMNSGGYAAAAGAIYSASSLQAVAWTVNDYAGMAFVVLTGTKAGLTGYIYSNSATILWPTPGVTGDDIYSQADHNKWCDLRSTCPPGPAGTGMAVGDTFEVRPILMGVKLVTDGSEALSLQTMERSPDIGACQTIAPLAYATQYRVEMVRLADNSYGYRVGTGPLLTTVAATGDARGASAVAIEKVVLGRITAGGAGSDPGPAGSVNMGRITIARTYRAWSDIHYCVTTTGLAAAGAVGSMMRGMTDAYQYRDSGSGAGGGGMVIV